MYNTGPRRARTLGRVLARGYLTSAATGGCEGSGCSARSKAVTKVLLRPVTGRRHQLRVHTLYMGHPIGTCAHHGYIGFGVRDRTVSLHSTRLDLNSKPHPCVYLPYCTVGDTTYTGDTDSLRMMLHAASLTLPFPANKVRWDVSAGWMVSGPSSESLHTHAHIHTHPSI